MADWMTAPFNGAALLLLELLRRRMKVSAGHDG